MDRKLVSKYISFTCGENNRIRENKIAWKGEKKREREKKERERERERDKYINRQTDRYIKR